MDLNVEVSTLNKSIKSQDREQRTIKMREKKKYNDISFHSYSMSLGKTYPRISRSTLSVTVKANARTLRRAVLEALFQASSYSGSLN